MLKSRVLTQSITLANATPAGLRTFYIDTPSDYQAVRGFYVIRNSGTDYLKITVKDAAGREVQSPVNISHLQVGNTVAIKDKLFKETPFKAAGTKIAVMIENFANTVGIQDIDFVYQCDNEPYE